MRFTRRLENIAKQNLEINEEVASNLSLIFNSS